MFSRNKNKIPAGTQIRSVPSIVSLDLKVTGDLHSEGEIQVDGHVTGDIRAKVLLVGKSAEINGEIFAETVRVHGNVNGQIKAKYVNLAKTARVVGDIHHENLSIQEGAFLEGLMVHMNEQEVKSALPEAKPAVAAKTAQTNAPAPTPAPTPAPVQAQANIPANTSQKSPSDGKPAKDRVNLVVKANAQDKNNKPTPSKHEKYPGPESKTV